jgi:hypothetical protein
LFAKQKVARREGSRAEQSKDAQGDSQQEDKIKHILRSGRVISRKIFLTILVPLQDSLIFVPFHGTSKQAATLECPNLYKYDER